MNIPSIPLFGSFVGRNDMRLNIPFTYTQFSQTWHKYLLPTLIKGENVLILMSLNKIKYISLRKKVYIHFISFPSLLFIKFPNTLEKEHLILFRSILFLYNKSIPFHSFMNPYMNVKLSKSKGVIGATKFRGLNFA